MYMYIDIDIDTDEHIYMYVCIYTPEGREHSALGMGSQDENADVVALDALQVQGCLVHKKQRLTSDWSKSDQFDL